MAQREVLVFPDPRLREPAQPVVEVDESIEELIADMLETMYHESGIGLAATQIGVAKRVIVIDVSEERDRPLVLVNPQIVEGRGEVVREEGCLSVPGYYAEVTRAAEVSYRGLDRDGQEVEGTADGLLAICIQHEIDHLDGKLFVDYLSELKRKRVRKRLEKRERVAS
ncbi:peptide deformylase [Halorhodospira halochloris]|uniref:Peptide deformylase n=1 Tax=Halorhodospira halochloris TaxID=1052 RepID=A0A0X8X753_HALHR|nr:peptide deformylase [Halorhodospira halochloris]MBK1650700.1 peptide deformylase [Halorhodospira halochloris]MCG5529809.1 peptide deformylase [Halorhodospira halochloris]MCG5548978.1 peptide deformylase [Halorhodospira halochloris]BAU56811.1 peptide deformylase [Halorhodospira halochloris]